MIKIENVVLASPDQMSFIIQGMRNPLNSWDKSDSSCGKATRDVNVQWDDDFFIGTNDAQLMRRLAEAGTDHRKFMRMMPVYVRITAGHTFWSEFDTYKVGTVRNSCSKMHKIHVMGFGLDSFDHEGIDEVGSVTVKMLGELRSTLQWLADMYNKTKEKKYWRAMIELLPMGYHLTANVELNYEVLANIYKSRKNHKMDEWREFCKWIETLPYSELITETSGKTDVNTEIIDAMMTVKKKED